MEEILGSDNNLNLYIPPNVKKCPSKLSQRLKKAAFAVLSKKKELQPAKNDSVLTWSCCDTLFTEKKSFHQHISTTHNAELDTLVNKLKELLQDTRKEEKYQLCGCRQVLGELTAGHLCAAGEEYLDVNTDWLPTVQELPGGDQEEIIILFYFYRFLPCKLHVYHWQKELCERLSLTGKIRVSVEGLNATVGGPKVNIEKYMAAVRNHPWFTEMQEKDFKVSSGSSADFPDGLKVGVYQELVPMGVDPCEITVEEAGRHLSPEEFHHELTDYLSSSKENNPDTVFIDCRNFYESKIGHFEGALCPDIRKFSYWPEYIQQNPDVFRDKKVLMYCTGGIRCERGSAYLRKQGLCKDVLQLEGGIHRYLEQYPDGYFKGKMYVFDERYAISPKDQTIAECSYCGEPWDRYIPCSQQHCHQLVLSCDACRSRGLTACCPQCQANTGGKEECTCTKSRPRIPRETVGTRTENKESNTQQTDEHAGVS